MKYGPQHVRHVFLYANDVCPQQQVREAAPHAELADREKKEWENQRKTDWLTKMTPCLPL